VKGFDSTVFDEEFISNPGTRFFSLAVESSLKAAEMEGIANSSFPGICLETL